MQAIHRPIGSTPHCKPTPHDKTLLELNGIGLESTADQYCNAITDFIAGNINEQECFAIMSARKVL